MKNTIKKWRLLYMMLLVLALLISMSVGILTPTVAAAAQTETVSISETTASSCDSTADIWGKLTPEEQKSLIEKVSSAKVYSKVVEFTNTRGSSSLTIESWSMSGGGVKLWSYFQKITWSYSGGQITSVTRQRWGTVYQVFWSFEGHIGNSETGGVGSSYYEAWTQGYFKCTIGGWTVQSQYPWIDMTVNADGTYQWSAG